MLYFKIHAYMLVSIVLADSVNKKKNSQMSVWTIVTAVIKVPVSISWLQRSLRSSVSVIQDGLGRAAAEVIK
jgi:hypothetical protein